MHVNTMELKKLRMEAGLSLRALALAAGVSHDTAMEIEAGRRTPHPATVKKLAEALNVNVGDLIDWEAEGVTQGKAAA
jgi:transcriptional regulator with XRE-family HTH domain